MDNPISDFQKLDAAGILLKQAYGDIEVLTRRVEMETQANNDLIGVLHKVRAERDAVKGSLERIQKLTLDRSMPPYATLAEIYSIAREGMEPE